MENKKVGVGIGVLFIKDNKVLLGKRDINSNLGGSWTAPGGKIDYGESFEDCAIREVSEETGIKLKKLEIICINNDIDSFAHFVTIGVLAVEWEGEPSDTEPDKISSWAWFDLDKLPELMFPPTLNILKNYKKNSFYVKDGK